MKTAVSAVIIKDRRVLLIKRWKDSKLEPWLWFVPWGRGEDNETPEETAVRECKEELNIEFTPWKIIQNIEDYWYDVYKIMWSCSWNIILQEDEIDGYGWFTYEEAIKLDVAFDMKEILEKLHKQSMI